VDNAQSYALCVGTITQRGPLTAAAGMAFCAGLGGRARCRAGHRESVGQAGAGLSPLARAACLRTHHLDRWPRPAVVHCL